MKSIKYNLLFLLAAVLFIACSNDDTDTPAKPANYAMFVTTNTEDGSGFLIPFEKFPEGEINITEKLKNGIQMAATRFAGVGFNGAVYAPANPLGDPGVQKFTLDASGRFVKSGFVPNSSKKVSYGSGPVFGFANNDKAYYTNHELNEKGIQILDLNTMKRTGEIDCSTAIDNLMATFSAEQKEKIKTIGMGGFMIGRDGKFYTQLFFSDEKNNEVIDKTFVVVVDIASDKVDKIIQWNDFIRISYYSCMNCNYVSIGDDNHIYLASFVGNFTDKEGPNYRVLRIKSGETDFDKTWDVNGNKEFSNGENFALGARAHRDKIYMKMFNIPIDVTFAGLSEKKYYAYELDMNTKKPRLIDDIPAGYWRSINGPILHNNKIYFIVETPDLDNANDPDQGKAFYYSYDPITKKSELAITVLNGQPQNIVQF